MQSNRTKTGLAILVLAAAVAQPGAQAPPRAPFKLMGLRVQRVAPGLVRATGGATLQVYDWTLHAELLELRTDPSSEDPSEILAEGFVSFERGNDKLHVRRLRLEPRLGRGSFEFHRLPGR